MKELIEVFKMEEIDKTTRADIIVRLGELINHQYSSNITEPIVYQLVMRLDPNHGILQNNQFMSKVK